MKLVAVVVAVTLVLAGCNGRVRRNVPAKPAAAVVIEAPARCGSVRWEWLKRQPLVQRAEGVVADADTVAVARGAQVDLANERLSAANSGTSKVLAALKQYGCVEVDDGK